MAPEYTLRKAHEELKKVTGLTYHVMGELEYYVVSPKTDLFLAADQRGYHESTPFNKGAEMRAMAMKYIAEAGGLIKYGHSEVGNFTKGDLMYEQNEIEFLPTNLEDAADQLMVAKWIIRTLADEYGVDVTFAPKITVGKAGSGLHIHTRLVKSLHQCIIVDISGIVIRISLGFFIAASRLYLFLHLAPDISRICDLSVFFQFFLTRLIRQCDVDPVAVETYFLYLFVIYERKEFIIADFLRTGSPHHGI